MADTKLSALTELAVQPDSSDEFYVNDGGTSKRIQYSTLLNGMTLVAPIIATTGAITDAGGDEYVVFTEATTPVTYIGITSGNTGVAPRVSAAGETNTNLHLLGTGTGNVYVSDGTDPTKDLNFELAGATTAKTMTIVSSQTDDRSLTLPDATDTLVGKATTDTLTNKTLTSPVITTMLIDDSDAGLTVTAADQTHATPTATIPDIVDAADTFVMNDTAATLTNKTLTLAKLSVAAGVTAAVGSSQGDGAITTDVVQISTCATAGDAVTLPTAAAGLKVHIINNGAEACDVFPASSDDCGGGVDTAVSLAAGANITYVAYDATTWVALT